MNNDLTAIEAVAEAWASIDGKLDEYRAVNQTMLDGYRDGYNCDAEELIKRVAKRGWKLVPA